MNEDRIIYNSGFRGSLYENKKVHIHDLHTLPLVNYKLLKTKSDYLVTGNES